VIDRLPTRYQIAAPTADELEAEIRASTALARRWRVAVRKTETVPPALPSDEGSTVDVLHEWIWRGGYVDRITTVRTEREVSRAERPLELNTAISRVRSYFLRSGFEFLRLGWTAKQVERAVAEVCLHPSTLDQWAGCMENERLTKLPSREVLGGSLDEVARSLRLDRVSLWISDDGSSLYVLASPRKFDGEGYLVARIDPRSVRLVVDPEDDDAAEEGSA